MIYFILKTLNLNLTCCQCTICQQIPLSPKDLKELLIEVGSKLPNNFELPRNSRKDIWYFYKTLTCVTYLEDNEIRIILKIPLINTLKEYEVYKIHNLPLPVHRVVPNQTDILLKYSLGTEMLMVSKDRKHSHFYQKVLIKCVTVIIFSSVIQRQYSIRQT